MVEVFRVRQLPLSLLPGLLALLTAMNAWGDNGQKSNSPAAAKVDPETERIVLQLVQSHLPELTDVLKQLRAVQPREYELAIKDLSKAAGKLELARNRDQRLFEIEVELLQAEQQTSLLIAKLKVRDSESDRKRLRAAAKRLQQAQTARVEYDVDAFRQRLARSQQQLDSAVSRLESRKNDADEQLEKSYLNMLRKAGRDSKRSESDPPLSAKQPTESTSPAKSTKPPSKASTDKSSRN